MTGATRDATWYGRRSPAPQCRVRAVQPQRVRYRCLGAPFTDPELADQSLQAIGGMPHPLRAAGQPVQGLPHVAGGLFHALLVPRAAQVALERARRRPSPPKDLGEWDAPAPVTAVVKGMLALDTGVSLSLSRLGLALPGLSTWALCRKP